MPDTSVERVHVGFIITPEGSRDAAQPTAVMGDLVRHRDGLVLFDTGFAPVDAGLDPERVCFAHDAEPI
jgi:hypothetical protein